MNRRQQGEHLQQVHLMAWADAYTHEHPELRWLFAIPNGGARNVRVASKLKMEGVKSGVWDLFLPVPRGKYHGFFIEMKWGKNKLTPNQAEFGEFVNGMGYLTAVCYDWNDAADKIECYLAKGGE